MALWTYVIVEGHYLSELLIYKSVTFNAGFLSPLIVGSTCMSSYHGIRLALQLILPQAFPSPG